MRKMLILFMVIATAIAPSFAQEVAILDVAADTEELSTFVSLFEAANIMDSLSRGGHFTIFAPSNEAWDALPERLGMTMDELLDNPALLRQILRYHIVAQVYTMEDLSTQLDAEGHRFLRTVEGSQILVTGNEQGMFLNENLLLQDTGTSFVMNNLFASNGVVHVIDSVLLPPTDGVKAAQIRVANLITDAPLLDVYINGELSSIEPLAYSDMSGWLEIPVGQYEIAFVPAGGMYADALMNPITVDASADAWLTIAATGSIETVSLETEIVTENLDRALFEGNARLTILFDMPEMNAVNVLANEELIVTGLLIDENLGGSASLDLPAGVYTLQFVNADVSQALITSFEIALEAETANLVTVTGSQDNPQIMVEITEMDELEEIAALILPSGR